FDEELKHDVEARRAQRLPHADLARALGDGHEHDVHDADAADQQPHRAAAGEQVFERLRRLLEGRQNVRLIADLEVVVLAGADLVLAPQHTLDLDHRQVHGVQVRGLGGDAAQPVGADEAIAGGLQWDENLLVRVEERSLRALLREHPDDLERDPRIRISWPIIASRFELNIWGIADPTTATRRRAASSPAVNMRPAVIV